jgi:MOSC domain-containing protein YiiM
MSTGMSAGRLVGIARREMRRAPMQQIAQGLVSVEAGLAGDSKGARFALRQITVLAREAWEAAAAAVGCPDLPWTVRRANLLVEGVELPRAKGGILRVGAVRLEVTGQTYPCSRMEEARAGLLKALAVDWRGGVTCRVLSSAPIGLGEEVEVLVRPPEVVPRLPA